MFRWVFLVLFFGVCACAGEKKKKEPVSFGRGWGNGISWVKSYEAGLSQMVKSKKPLMVIHHKEDCPYSKALKEAFSSSKAIMKMAKEDFIMVNLVEETSDENMAPDGYYVPRILFVDPSKTVRAEITGRYSNNLYTYEPSDMDLLYKNMKRAKNMGKDEL